MRVLDSNDRYELMAQPRYGFDCYGDPVIPQAGYSLVPEGDQILKGDKPFDVYAGWMFSDGYDARNGHHARSNGRWTAWERKVRNQSTR